MMNKILLSEISFSFSRSSGAGGQNINKVNSKAMLLWNIDRSLCLTSEEKQRFIKLFPNLVKENGEVILTCQEYRTQKSNVEGCMDKLQKMILKAVKIPKIRKKTRPSKASQEKRVVDKKRMGEKKRLRRAGGD